MFHDMKDRILNMVSSRLFLLFVIFIGLGGTLVYRIFDLQIVNGENYMNNFKLKIRKERSIACTRGNIYDRFGELLAYNELAYNVTIEDVYESGSDKNEKLNGTIRKLIDIIEQNGDHIIRDFNIILDKDGNYQFNVEDKAKLRFLADVYGYDSTDKLTYSQKTATPQEVIEYLSGPKKYAIGECKKPGDNDTFVPGMGYTREQLLKMITIRYAMSLNGYQKYIATTVASNVNKKTVAVVMENTDILDGVSIAEDTVRQYVDSVYFAHILGYTGKISQEELLTLSKDNNKYSATDMVGKAGIEQVMEHELQGKKGSETMYVDNLGKVIEITERKEPVAGNDLYLTIDKNLQKAVYNILEKKIAGILVSKLSNIREFNGNGNSANIIIPIYDVYNALINNNIIDVTHFERAKDGTTEHQVYQNYQNKKASVFAILREEMESKKTPYQSLSDEYKVYESFIVNMLSSSAVGILQDAAIDINDDTYIAWKTEETISLAEYLNYAISQNWIDVTKVDLDSKYASSDEIYARLIDVIFENLDNNSEFSKKVYRYMINNDELTGRQICMILLEQGIVEISEADENAFTGGKISAFQFMLERIENLDITPAQLAMDPCSGSCVVTDVNTGEVRALVTYPGYDTNRLANSIDAEYYNQLQTDLSKPMWNYATQQKSAPGSTFKMVSSVAGMEDGVIGVNEHITCEGIFEKISPFPKCWIASKGTHGPLDVAGAIQNSCNFFFYEVGYRLGSEGTGVYNSDRGLDRIREYASLFGLSETSGIEIVESEPEISDFDAVRSAIGQGTHNYTTVGLARYVTCVANSGTCFKLSLLDKLTDHNGNLLVQYTPKIRNHIDLPEREWYAIHSGMRRVVESKAYYENMPVAVAGKTGTAQENKNRPNHALFVGYAPYSDPQVSIATRVAFGYASDYAAEISRDVLRYYFDPDEEESILSGGAIRPDATTTTGD
ncbi:MAG: penicillin-binding protein [Lachnospiraceae bacterium]|nr:penicillin-binding protein [Lachnospiraceae bacterium]